MDNEKKIIVLVDDNPANLRIGKIVLSEQFTVATAPSAEKMFYLLKSIQPGIILLDIDMPEMDGYQTIEILKSNPDTQNIPVIFLTGMTGSHSKEKGYALGAADYIIKPFEPEKLIACIKQYI